MSWLSQLWIEVRVRLFGARRTPAAARSHRRGDAAAPRDARGAPGRRRCPGDEAYARARRGFGNPTVIREATLDMWRYGSMDVFLQDVRYGTRLLRRNPIFALTAALSLAIGIGANTTVFSVANRLLLREPAGVNEADRLVDIAPTSESGRYIEPFLSHRVYLEIRERATTLESVYGYHIEPYPMSLAGPGGAERIFSTFVTGNYFTALGVRPAVGRLFGAADSEQPGAAPIAVLSHAFWVRRFNADPSVVGRTLQLTGRLFSVVGVAPEGFRGTTVTSADLWLPVSMRSMTRDQGPSTFLVGGRLKPGVSVRQAAAEVDAIGRAIRRESPPNPGSGRFRTAHWGASSCRGIGHSAAASPADQRVSRLPDGDRLARAPDRVRERRRRPAGAGHRPAPGDCRPSGDRRRTRAAHSTTAHGNAAAVRARRRPRCCARARHDLPARHGAAVDAGARSTCPCRSTAASSCSARACR